MELCETDRCVLYCLCVVFGTVCAIVWYLRLVSASGICKFLTKVRAGVAYIKIPRWLLDDEDSIPVPVVAVILDEDNHPVLVTGRP